MKHLKRFNEAIVEWETDNIKAFYQELKDKLSNLPRLKYTLSFDDIKEVGEKHDIEVVNYDTFLNDLPTEQMKKDAPPRGVPAFGLVNPVTHKARIVLNTNTIDQRLLDYVYHMLKHENVHVGQKSRKKDKSAGEFLGDVTKTKEYFSNKDEVMAFAQSVSDMVMDMYPKSLEQAIKMIDRTPLWRPIQTVDEKTKKRYKKYIYLYLEREFEKRNQTKKP
jgi:hypothetical protein